MKPLQTVIIGGRESRHGAQALAETTRLLERRGIAVAESHLVKDRAALRKGVRRFVKSGRKLIVVCGGDGAQTTACEEMAHSDSVLAVIPGGTGNSFAQTLGVPHDDIEGAVDVICNGRSERIDLGYVNKRYFANFSTIGLTAEVGANTPHWLKQIFGAFAYAIGAAPLLATEPPFRVRISTEKRTYKLKTYQIVVANGRYFGSQPLTPDAEPTDGELALFTTTGLSRAALVRMYFAVVAGTQTQLPDALYFNAKRIEIKTRRRLLVSIDGDPGGYTPATFRVARRALRVMVPQSFPLRG